MLAGPHILRPGPPPGRPPSQSRVRLTWEVSGEPLPTRQIGTSPWAAGGLDCMPYPTAGELHTPRSSLVTFKADLEALQAEQP